jgi:putative heme-binding domain-containing protein
MNKHLGDAKPDVLFMCFGMADSFAGEAGLPAFKKNLQTLITEYGSKKYNGNSPPRLVLIGPIAHEKVGGQFPDPTKHNATLKRYSEAMQQVAREHGLPFVNLFDPMLDHMDEVAKTQADKLTINGIHLNAMGYWAAAQVVLHQAGSTDWNGHCTKSFAGDQTRTEHKAANLPWPPLPPGKATTILHRYLPLILGAEPGDAIINNGRRCEIIPLGKGQRGAWVRNSPIQAAAEQIRIAVVDQNQQWFYMWRAVNGEYIYGRRAAPFGIKNFPGEMAQIEQAVNELDRRIHELNRPGIEVWERVPALKGEKFKPVDKEVAKRNLPTVEEVFKQKQGIIGGQKFTTAADIDEARKTFKVPDGYDITCFASEKDFPLNDPLAMAFDAKGRLWVSTMPTYPQYLPGSPPNDKLLILEDIDGDGTADKCTVFADGLYLPTGFEFGDGGVYVAAQPNLMFLKDSKGGDHADTREVILHGFGTGDSHHAMHMFVWSPEGALHFQEGIFHRTNCETPWGVVRQRDAGIYRFQPKSHKLETYVSYNFANPWGHVFDKWGFNYIADASGGSNYNALPMTGRMPFPGQHPGMKVFTSVVRPTCGCEIVSSRHFPDAAQGNFLVNNNIGFQGIKQHRPFEEASGVASKELEPMLFSTDRNFRPVGIKFGPDGALYIVDWYNPLIGHMQFSLRDPNRDHYHGRIWRITAKNRPLVKAPKIAGEPIAKLLDLLKEYENNTRYRVRAELRERDAKVVAAELKKWIGNLKEDDAEYEHHLLEALWVGHGAKIGNVDLLVRLLRGEDYHVRAAATRQLRYVDENTTLKSEDKDVVSPDRPAAATLLLLEEQVNDVHPRVRLEAIVALSFFESARAADIALQALKHPTDYYIDYALKETMTTLQPYWKEAIAKGSPIAVNNPAGAAYLLANVTTLELVKVRRSPLVYAALLSRDNVPPQFRQEALEGFARINKTDVLTELFTAIERIDKSPTHSDHALHDLVQFFSGRDGKAFAKIRPGLEKLAAGARMPLTRQVAYVAMVTADNGLEHTWTEASKSVGTLRDVVEAVPLIPNAKLRDGAYDKVAALLHGLPPELAKQAGKSKGTRGRFVRIELPGDSRTLTLAEVEVFSHGSNVARQGIARQSSMSHGGVASRAIDGNTSGIYADASQTHSREGDRNPWWEVDLGEEVPIEGIRIWNRTESSLGQRLNGYRLCVLNTHRMPVFVKENQPAPAVNVAYKLDIDPAETLKLAAMNAITSIPGHDAEVFTTLAGFVRAGKDRDAAVRALRRIPKNQWPKNELRPLLAALIAFAAKLPAEQRAEPAVLDALQLGSDVVALLPAAERKDLQEQLGKLGVQVVLVRTVPHAVAFDVAEFYVEAGQPVVILLENPDIAPHNLAICAPGSLQEVGQAAEAMANAPDGFARGFVPAHPKVLFSTRLTQPRESDRLKIVAPKTPGNYIFVCTFPGHWGVMNGVMHVVPRLDAIPIAERVKYAIDKKWTVAELSPELELMTAGRNYERGRELFKLRSCVQCHKIGGISEGPDIGPNLAELPKKLADGKFARADLLREVLDPSAIIDQKYRMHSFVLDSGAQVQGVILYEDAKIVRIVKNAVEKPVEILKATIDERTELKTSLMPNGLLDRLAKDDVFDLLAFIAAGGDASHSAFLRKE